MNHKYLNSETFEIMDNVFGVDESIAETISMLNKKGYYTKYCCSGHTRDPRLYEMYNVKNNEDFELKSLGYVVNENMDSYNILMPYTFTAIYIMFEKAHNFNNLPNNFKQNNNTIELIIDYYIKDKRKNWREIEREIDEANKILLEWVISLPDVKKAIQKESK